MDTLGSTLMSLSTYISREEGGSAMTYGWMDFTVVGLWVLIGTVVATALFMLVVMLVAISDESIGGFVRFCTTLATIGFAVASALLLLTWWTHHVWGSYDYATVAGSLVAVCAVLFATVFTLGTLIEIHNENRRSRYVICC